MIGKAGLTCALMAATLLVGDVVRSQPKDLIDELVVLDNDSIRIVLLTYQRGADSDIHLNLGPEITIVQEGELALYTPKGQEVLKAGTVHWLPDATAHLARNEGERPVKFWALLLQQCD